MRDSLRCCVGCTVVAVFTEISGLTLWLTGGVAVWLLSQGRERAAPRLLAWLVAAGCVSFVYLLDLRLAPSSSTMAVLEWPVRFAIYTGAVLGLPFAFWMPPRWAAVVGYGGLILLAVSAWWLYRSNQARLKPLFPFLLFALHGVLVSSVIALGRSAGDPESALTSHYSFAPNLYWVGVLAVAAVACSTWLSAATPRARRAGRALAGTAALLLTAFYVRGNVEGSQRAYARSRNLQMALVTLSSPGEIPRPVLRFLYPPDEERARALVAQLRASALGPFASGANPDAATLAARFAPTAAGPDADGFLDGGDCLGATGWAWDPGHPDQPVTLDVWSGDVLLGTATANWFRWDLLAAGKGNGQHVFRLAFPEQGTLGTGRAVRITFAGTDRPLRGSPTTVFCRD